MRRTLTLLLALVALAAGCGGESDAEQAREPVASGTLTGTAVTTEAATTEAQTLPEVATRTAADARGDTSSPDLDIVAATITRDELVRVELALAGPPGGDVIYSASLSCGDQLWQLGYKVAAGATTVFAFDFGGSQYDADGEVEGSTVSISYPAAEMGCTGPIEVQFVAEGTNDRAPDSDYVPEPGPDPLNPKRLRLA